MLSFSWSPGKVCHSYRESRLLTKKYLKAQVVPWLITLGKSGSKTSQSGEKAGKDVFTGQGAICRDVDQVQPTGKANRMLLQATHFLGYGSVH